MFIFQDEHSRVIFCGQYLQKFMLADNYSSAKVFKSKVMLYLQLIQQVFVLVHLQNCLVRIYPATNTGKSYNNIPMKFKYLEAW